MSSDGKLLKCKKWLMNKDHMLGALRKENVKNKQKVLLFGQL